MMISINKKKCRKIGIFLIFICVSFFCYIITKDDMVYNMDIVNQIKTIYADKNNNRIDISCFIERYIFVGMQEKDAVIFLQNSIGRVKKLSNNTIDEVEYHAEYFYDNYLFLLSSKKIRITIKCKNGEVVKIRGDVGRIII